MVLLGMAYSLVLAAFGLAVLLSKLRRLGDLIRIEASGVARPADFSMFLGI